MQSMNWLTFCLTNTLTRSVVHFFPASNAGVSAPYPAECRLTLFGNGIEPKSVVLEGARFSQPDGIRLDEAFPSLREGNSSFFGLEIEISTIQPRIDITGSACIIEFIGSGQSCRFRPALRSAYIGGRPLLGLKDGFNSTSFVVVNGSNEVYKPQFNLSENGELYPLPQVIEPVAARNVLEIELAPSVLDNLKPNECSWGLLRARGIWAGPNEVPDVTSYVLYRDAATKRPVSIRAI